MNAIHDYKLVELIKENIPVRMVSYGGSNYNISFLVRKQDKVRALQALSRSIFGADS